MKKLILTFILSIIHLSLSTMQPAQKTINLIVGEDIFEVPQSIALQALTLKQMAEDLGLSKDIELPAAISAEVMGQVSQIMWSFYSHGGDLKGKALLDAIEKDISNQNIPWIGLLQAFNYLDFPVGLALVARAIAKDQSFLKQFMQDKGLKDLCPLVAKYYYLLNGKNLSLIDEHGKNLIDEKSYGFSIQDYLDYQPQMISSRRSGVSLDLGNMRLNSLEGLGTIAGFANLRELNLADNQLSVLPAGIFNGLANLKRLHLRNNQLSAFPAGIFNGLANLQVLELRHNQLSALPAAIFNGLANLQALSLDNNQLTMLPEGIFDGLGNLQWLNLNYNQLSALPAGIFKGLAKLHHLNLNHNQLSTLPTGTFDGLAALRALYLGSNQLSALPVGIFKGLTNLQELELDNNQLSKETKEELRASLVSLPDLRFSF